MNNLDLLLVSSALQGSSPAKEHSADPLYNAGGAQPHPALLLLYHQVEYMELLKGERNGKK